MSSVIDFDVDSKDIGHGDLKKRKQGRTEIQEDVEISGLLVYA